MARGMADDHHFAADHVVGLPAGPLVPLARENAGVGRGAGKILVAPVWREAQLDLGVTLMEVGQARHQPGAGQRRHAGQRQLQPAVLRAQSGAQGFDGAQRFLGAVIELAASVGQRQAVRVAAHQRLAEMRLQARDRPADRALGHAQRLGSLGEAAQAGRRDEGVQLRHGRRMQTHRAISCMIFGNEGVQYSRLKGDRKVRTLAACNDHVTFPE